MRNVVTVAVIALVLMLGCVTYESDGVKVKAIGKGEAAVIVTPEGGDPVKTVELRSEGVSENLAGVALELAGAIGDAARAAASFLTGGRVGGQ